MTIPAMKNVIPSAKAIYEMIWMKCSISIAIGVWAVSVRVITLAIKPMNVLSPTAITSPRPWPDLTRVP